MSRLEAEMTIGSPESQFVRVRPQARPHPECADYWDGNWVNTAVQVSAGAFQGSYVASLRTDEFRDFRIELEQLRDVLDGTASFSSMEEWLLIKVSGDGRGHFKAKCEARDDAGIGNCLAFELSFDQTDLPSILRGLSAIEEAFPVVGTRE